MYPWLLIAVIALGCGGGAPRPGQVVKKVKKEVKGAVKEARKDVVDVVKDVTRGDGLSDDDKTDDRVVKRTFDTPKGKRFAWVHVPDGHDASTPAPLIFAFHGGTGSSTAAKGFVTRWSSQLDKQAIVVFPNGQDSDSNEPAWSSRDYSDRSDVDFTLQVLEAMKAEYNIDPSRVYASGFSNGGLMTTMVACHEPGPFAGFAIYSQTIHKHIAKGCDSNLVRPTLYLMGTADKLWEERDFSHSAMNTVDWWRDRLGCSKVPEKTDIPDGPDDTTVQRWTWAPCQRASGFEFLRIENGEHIWPGPGLPERSNTRSTDIDGATEVIAFFRKYADL